MLEFHEPVVAHIKCRAVVWQPHTPRVKLPVYPSLLGDYLLAVLLWVSGALWLFPQQINENSGTPWSWQSQNLVQQNKSLNLFDLLPCLRGGQLNGKAGDVPKCPSCQSLIQSMSAPLFLLNQDGFSFELWSIWGFCCLLTWAVLSHWVSGVQKGEFFPPFQQHPGRSFLLCSCWLCLQPLIPTFPSYKARKLLNGASFSPRTEWLILAVFLWPTTHKCPF